MWQKAGGAVRGGGGRGGKGKSFKSTANRIKTVSALGKLTSNANSLARPPPPQQEPISWQGLTNHIQNPTQLRDDLQINVPNPTPAPAATVRSQPEKWDISYLKVEFEDIIAEPQGTNSPDFVWKNAQTVYKTTKNQCYSLLTMLFALPLTVFFAISIAFVQFQHVWCFVPAVKHCKIGCHVIKQYVTAACGACLEPMCLSLGAMFSRIRVNGDTNHKTREFV